MILTEQTAPQRAPSDSGDEYVHIVGHIQHWLDRLGLKIPRALCGVSLDGDPDRPDPGFNAPACPACADIKRRG